MNPPENRLSGKSFLSIVVANSVWWLVPIAVLLISPKADALPLVLSLLFAVSLVVAIPVCAQCRNSVWIVSIWVPAFVGSVLGAGKLWLASAVASSLMFGGEAALIIGGIALALSVAAVLCLVFHPRLGDNSGVAMALSALAIANMGAISYVTHEVSFKVNRQDIIVHVIDPKGLPILGAAVTYKVYGYGERGGRTSEPDITGGPIKSDENGIVRFRSLGMRHEVDGVIAKTGFRQISFNVGMQFDKSEAVRDLKISTPESGIIAESSVPSKESVEFSIYLPPKEDAPGEIQCIDAHTGLSGTGKLSCFLNVETGKFSKAASGDLEFEASFKRDGDSRLTLLQVTGINGSSVMQFAWPILLSGSLSPYEAVYLIAPESGYMTTLTVNESGNEPTFYVRGQDGRSFARVVVNLMVHGQAMYAVEDKPWSANMDAKIYKNPNGSRLLESRWLP
jgi:hypothetical protein